VIACSGSRRSESTLHVRPLRCFRHSRSRHLDCSGRLACRVLLCHGLNHSCETAPRLSALQGVSSRSFLSCGIPQGSVLGPVLFLIYCADVIATARRRGLGVHSYADDSHLYFHVDPAAVYNKIQQLVDCVDKIRYWMSTNRLKLNKEKTQFIWLGTPHQLSKLDCQTITLASVAIKMSTEATCLAVLMDSTLTFAPHVCRLSGKSFYYL